jgi:hypothetical protein
MPPHDFFRLGVQGSGQSLIYGSKNEIGIYGKYFIINPVDQCAKFVTALFYKPEHFTRVWIHKDYPPYLKKLETKLPS